MSAVLQQPKVRFLKGIRKNNIDLRLIDRLSGVPLVDDFSGAPSILDIEHIVIAAVKQIEEKHRHANSAYSIRIESSELAVDVYQVHSIRDYKYLVCSFEKI